MSRAAEHVLGVIMSLTVLFCLLYAAAWLIEKGALGAGDKFVEKCHEGRAFELRGEQVICLNRDGLERLLQGYDEFKKKRSTTPL